MRSTFSARIRKAMAAVPVLLLAFSLIPSAAFADEETPMPLAGELVGSRTFMLPTSTMTDATAITITSGVVELSTESALAPIASTLSTIRATYVAAGCVYTFDEEARGFMLVNSTNADLTPEGFLVVPSALVLDGVEHPVTGIAAGALSGVDTPLVALSCSVSAVDIAAIGGNTTLQAIYVSPLNEAYSSYDGCLYSKADNQLMSLLLVPEGKQGAVRIPSGAEVVNPETFSHCDSVDAISVDAGSAAFFSRNVFIPDAIDAEDAANGADAQAYALGTPNEAEPIDYASIVIDESAFAPIVIPTDNNSNNDDASAGDDDADGTPNEEGDADSTASPSEPEASGAAFAEKIVFSSTAAPTYRFHLDGNGGDLRGLSSTRYTVTEGAVAKMPSLGTPTAASLPKREGYVFLGFYDGSDYQGEGVKKYYNPDFTQDGCEKAYTFGTHGLRLYAGWAPMIRVDVPTNVGITMGTILEMDGPTTAEFPIHNLSPWEVVCTSLSWDVTGIEGDAAEIDHIQNNHVADEFGLNLPIGAAEADRQEGVVEVELQESTAAFEEMFGDANKVAIKIIDPTTERFGKVYATATATGDEVSCITVPAPSDGARIEKRTYDFTIAVDGTTVEIGDGALSNTILTSTFEARGAPESEKKSAILFDQRGAEGDYRIESVPGTFGEFVPSVAPVGSETFTAPKKQGYTFKGYFDTPAWNAVSAKQYYSETGEPVDVWDKEAATVLYAGWSNDDCTVVFDANGGTVEGAQQWSTTVPFDWTLGERMASLPTAEYWPSSADSPIVVYKWYTDPIGGEPVTLDYPMKSLEGVTFYAHWDDAAGPIVVSLHGNGGVFVDGAETYTLDTTNSGLLADLMTIEPVCPGFTFDGWRTVGGVKLESAPPVIGALDLYASWRGKSVKVKWSLGGWTTSAGAPETPDPTTITYQTNPVPTLNTAYPQEPTYSASALDRFGSGSFVGWYVMDEKTGEATTERPVSVGTPWPTDDTIYNAFWNVPITWNTNDESDAVITTSVMLSTDVALGDIPPGLPVRAGYTCEGWFTADGAPVTSATIVSGPVTFYAHWKGAEYEITYDAVDGSFDGERYATIPSTCGSALNLPVNPTRAGYTFEKWTDAPEGGTAVTSSTITPAAAATYYAQWKANTYTITLLPNGGSGGQAMVQHVTYGQALPTLTSVPGRENYLFDGYFDTQNLTGGTLYYRVDGNGTRSYDIADDVTLYARWINAITGGDPEPFPGGEDVTVKQTQPTGASLAASAVNAKAVAGAAADLFDGTFWGSVKWNSKEAVPGASTDVVVTVNAYVPNEGHDMRFVEQSFEAQGKRLLGFQDSTTGYFVGWDVIKSGASFSFATKGENLTLGTAVDNVSQIASVAVKTNIFRAVYTDVTTGTVVVNTFDANPGTFTGDSGARVRYRIMMMTNGTFLYPVASDAPTREGYTFDGWYTADGKKVTDVGFVAPAAATTYYARWRGETVTVSWDAGTVPAEAGAVTVQSMPTSVAVERGQRLSTALGEMPKPLLAYCMFAGWYPKGADAGASAVTLDTVVNGDVTYVARWTFNPHPTTITFDNAWSGSTTSNFTKEVGYTDAMPSLTTVPVKTGYDFTGYWDAQTNGTQYYKYESGVISVTGTGKWDKLGDTATLYARFTPKTFVVTFDSAGGAPTPVDTTVTYNGSIAKPAGYAAPTRDGYTLDGWYSGTTKYLNLDGTSVIANYTGLSALSLMAQWTPVAYGITYHLNGGTNHSSNPSSFTVETATITLKNPSKTGYTFGGWWTTSGFTAGTQVTSIPKGSQGDYTLYAKWTIVQYTVSYNANAGGYGDVPLSVKVDHGASYAVTDKEPTRSGYAFKGWASTQENADNMQVDYAKGSVISSITSDMTLYAVWTPTSYGITYNLNGGTNHSSNPTSYTVETNSINLQDPSKTGYTFGGWWTTSGFTAGTQVTSILKGSQGDYTLYAKWTIVQYTVSYNANAGGYGTVPLSVKVDHGASYTVTDKEPTRSGYAFKGWASTQENADNMQVDYAKGSVISSITSDMTLYAVWKDAFKPSTTDPNTPPSGTDGDFYLPLNSAQAAYLSTENIEVLPGCYGASKIKAAAIDISNNRGENSNYYKIFQRIMYGGYMFKTKWKNVDSINATSVLSSTYTYDVRLIGVYRDYATPNGTNGYFAGLTFQFADKALTYPYRFNNTNSNASGWINSELRARMNSGTENCTSPEKNDYIDDAARQSIWNRAPKGITDNIQPVYKNSHNMAGDKDRNTNQDTTMTRDQFFIASYAEIIASPDTYFTGYGWTGDHNWKWVRYEAPSSVAYGYYYWKNASGSAANPGILSKMSCDASSPSETSWTECRWWERTCVPGQSRGFLHVSTNGSPYLYGSSNINENDPRYVVPCWCF